MIPLNKTERDMIENMQFSVNNIINVYQKRTGVNFNLAYCEVTKYLDWRLEMERRTLDFLIVYRFLILNRTSSIPLENNNSQENQNLRIYLFHNIEKQLINNKIQYEGYAPFFWLDNKVNN